MTQIQPTESHIIVSGISYQWPRIRPTKGMSNRHLQKPGKVQRLSMFPHQIIKLSSQGLEESRMALDTSIIDSEKDLIPMPERKTVLSWRDRSSLTPFWLISFL